MKFKSKKHDFSWYQYLFYCLPLGLVAIGGAVGGLIGGLATAVNFKMGAGSMPKWLTLFLSLFVSAIAAVTFFWTAYIITLIIESR